MAREHFLKNRSRALRRDSTDAEKLLWRHLRNRTLEGVKFRRQVQIDHYIVDFLCPSARLIIELDGSQHTVEGDEARSAYLESQGFRLLRFWNDDVLINVAGVWEIIAAALDSPPHPAR